MAEVVITGGLGFIGSAFIGRLLRAGRQVLNVDLDTYAGDERRLPVASKSLRTVRMDVADPALVDLVVRERPTLLVHFAAETHVTRSERGEPLFMRTNVQGTRRVLQAAGRAGVELSIHISTDEVYGPRSEGHFRETDKLPGEGLATSAYARSKALADEVACSFFDRAQVLVVRPTNCFGPWQHPEKAVPRWTIRALSGQHIPVWGDGRQVRDWMFVEDACAGIELLAERGSPGHIYNLGPQGPDRSNFEIAALIARAAGREDGAVYLTDYDRPDHDRRYAVDASRIRGLGWRPSAGLEERIEATVDWYQNNGSWWAPFVHEAENLYDDIVERRLTA